MGTFVAVGQPLARRAAELGPVLGMGQIGKQAEGQTGNHSSTRELHHRPRENRVVVGPPAERPIIMELPKFDNRGLTRWAFPLLRAKPLSGKLAVSKGAENSQMSNSSAANRRRYFAATQPHGCRFSLYLTRQAATRRAAQCRRIYHARPPCSDHADWSYRPDAGHARQHWSKPRITLSRLAADRRRRATRSRWRRTSLFMQSVLAAKRPDHPPHDIYFADGNDARARRALSRPGFRDESARLRGGCWRSSSAKRIRWTYTYRNHEIPKRRPDRPRRIRWPNAGFGSWRAN